MTHLPIKPTPSAADISLSMTQFETIANTLQSLIGLIMPLHQLLQFQSGLEDKASARLEEVLAMLGAISISLQSAAEAMTSATQAGTTAPVLQNMVENLVSRQNLMEGQVMRIDRNLQVLMQWLGTPPQ